MKKNIMACVFILMVACLPTGCSSWREVTIRISEEQLQEHINKKFPVIKTHQFLGTITYAHPLISLQREDNRVEFGLEISLSSIMINGSNLHGTVVVLASVVYSPEKKALFLADPQLQKFILNGVPQENAQSLSELYLPALKKLLTRKPLYRLKEQDGVKKIAGMLVKDIRVRSGSLEVLCGI